jgi:lysophospholipase L1-like esterase
MIGYNDYGKDKPLPQFRTDLAALLTNLRRRQPRTPIYLITPIWSEPESAYTNALGLHLASYRTLIRDLAMQSKDSNLHWIDGLSLMPHEASLLADGIHPNDRGFEFIADRLAAKLH